MTDVILMCKLLGISPKTVSYNITICWLHIVYPKYCSYTILYSVI